MSIIREPTVTELADREASKKAKHAARIQQGIDAGWRLIDIKKECFKLDELPPNDAGGERVYLKSLKCSFPTIFLPRP